MILAEIRKEEREESWGRLSSHPYSNQAVHNDGPDKMGDFTLHSITAVVVSV